MIDAADFVQQALLRGFNLYSGVPCSYQKAFINHVIASDSVNYIAAANEGDAVAIASGAELGGRRSVAMMQNSGLGNAVSPLTSLNQVFHIPLLLIISLRGDPDSDGDEPQHNLMGPITTQMLDLMQIPWCYFPEEDQEIEPVLDRAVSYMDEERRPFALVMRKGAVQTGSDNIPLEGLTTKPWAGMPKPETKMRRVEALQAIQDNLQTKDLVIATTGFTGRELYQLGDDDRQFYMVGSMGCASSLGLGLATARPDCRVIVLDGDGALLMRMGSLATLGHYRPKNLFHLVLDNGVHDSTGGQSTVSASIDFCAVAAACGYPTVSQLTGVDEVSTVLNRADEGLAFYHVPIIPGSVQPLVRPSVTPVEVASRLKQRIEVVR